MKGEIGRSVKTASSLRRTQPDIVPTSSRTDRVVRKRRIYALDFDSGASTLLADSGKGARPNFNDGKADRRGRFVLGLSDTDFADTQPVGGLFSLGADHKLVELDDGVNFSNSHCFSPDGRTLHCSGSFLHTTCAYD